MSETPHALRAFRLGHRFCQETGQKQGWCRHCADAFEKTGALPPALEITAIAPDAGGSFGTITLSVPQTKRAT